MQRFPAGTSPLRRVAVPLAESYAFCRSLAKRRGGNFYFSFLTLPRLRFRAMCALYGFMRVCDDIGDEPAGSLAQKEQNLREWRRELHEALAEGSSAHPVLPALADVVRNYGIPAAYLEDVIDGVQADVRFSGLETFEELARYCYQVAGAVGLCCLHIWGFDNQRAIDRAVDCGTAFQLTNILRDLKEDAALGRFYLPREDLRRFAVTTEDIAAGRCDDRFRELMAFQVQRAREYYRGAGQLFEFIRPPGKPALAAMLTIYRSLLEEIARRDYDVFSQRIALSRFRKLRIAVGAILRYRILRWWR